MNDKPRILVMTASGKTGLLIARRLLSEGFPITALVHKEDKRSADLRGQGADVVVGSGASIDDVRKAMTGAQRAYFNNPIAAGSLRAAAVFISVAAEQKLQTAVVLSQWLANPKHPSLHTREVWLADRLLALLPETAVTTINVGFFADNDLQLLPFAAQFGLFMPPYGAGRNAPPSNEDIAAVAAEILAWPSGHAGKTYRPTGPQLLSPQDIAALLGKVVKRKVKYINAPSWIMLKVMRGMGFSDYVIAQFQQYVLDYQLGTFAANAPTDVVRTITGQEPEDFATIARRYAAAMPGARPGLGAKLLLMVQLALWLLLPLPKAVRHPATGDFVDQEQLSLSANSSEWLQSHLDNASIAAEPDTSTDTSAAPPNSGL